MCQPAGARRFRMFYAFWPIGSLAHSVSCQGGLYFDMGQGGGGRKRYKSENSQLYPYGASQMCPDVPTS